MTLITGRRLIELRTAIREDWQLLISLKERGGLSPSEHLWFVQTVFQHLIDDSEKLREELGMARRQDNNSTWVGFVDVKLTNEEKDIFSAWEVQDEDLWLIFEETVRSGHKFALTHNKQNDNFVASVTGLDGHKTNAGYTLSAFAPSWYAAVRVLMFKHHMILEGDWRKAKERKTDEIG